MSNYSANGPCCALRRELIIAIRAAFLCHRNLTGQFVALIGQWLVFSNDRRAAEQMF